MVDFSGITDFGAISQSNLGIFSLFINHPEDSSFTQAVTRDSDFAKLLLAQIQNESLKMLGIFGGATESSGSEENVSLYDLTSVTSPQTGGDFLSSFQTSDETEDIFSEQLLSILRLNQIKVFEGLVGKKVRGHTSDGTEIEGVVEAILWEKDRFVFKIGDQKISPESISEVLS
jgi:hypothetical protein